MSNSNGSTKLEEQATSRSPATWVWYSRPGTTERGIFSVLALIEVFLAVAAYWGYAIWAHTQAHLLIAALIAPFLLLRSDQSVELGRFLFSYFDFDADFLQGGRWFPWSRRIFESLDRTSTPNLTKLFLVLIISIALVIGGLVAALLIRIVATACHPIAGIASLSKNWWRTLFATDIVSPPELIPGHNEKGSYFNVQNFIVVIKENISDPIFGRTFATKTLSLVIVTFLSLANYVLFFGPSYLYRMSIKSTAWIHWPLAYISRPLSYADDVEEVRLRLWSDPREWLRRAFMLCTITGVLVAAFPSVANVNAIFPKGVISVVEYAFLIDVKSLVGQPWRAVALVSALITLILTWYGWELSILVARSSVRSDRLVRARSWAALLEYAMRVRTVCGWIFWTLLVVHAGLWLVPSTEWLGEYPREILKFIYGDFLPPAFDIPRLEDGDWAPKTESPENPR